MRRDEAALLDIVLAASDVADFVAGVAEADFAQDRLVQAAVERNCRSSARP